MESAAQNVETEIKLRAASVGDAQHRLDNAGFRVKRERVFEQNLVLDTPAGALRTGQQLLRLRQAGQVVTVTYKGPPLAGPHKSREEIEFEASSLDQARTVFERLGFHPQFRYDKYRTEFERTGEAGLATLDETPLGVFLELEGPAAWIDENARDLGYSQSDYILSSYSRLYAEDCRLRQIPLTDMVFG